MDLRALGIALLLQGQVGLQAGDLGGELRTVELRRRAALLGLLQFGLHRGLLPLGRASGHGGLGRLARHFRRRGGRRDDLVDLGVLEGRDLGGLGRRLVFQRAAALLVVLGEEVGLLGRHVALEGGQGDFQRLADLAGLGQGETQAEDQRDVQRHRQEQGEAQAVGGANPGRFEGGGDGCGH